MVSERPQASAWNEILQHPLLRHIGNLASSVTNTGFLVVYPSESGWGQLGLDGTAANLPEFCRLIHSSKTGAANCKLCHVMMAIGACGGEPCVQRCHAGTSVLVSPAPASVSDNLAVISTCQFAEPEGVGHIHEMAAELGLDPKAVEEAYLKLPALTDDRILLIQSTMNAINEAIRALHENDELRERASSSLRSEDPNLVARLDRVQRTLEARGHKRIASDAPPLIRVVCELIDRNPQLPLMVKQLADAARVTPNYFSALFHKHTGMPFIDYLTEVRMARAQELLADLTLNVSDVARLVGYEDPGYFTRRFRNKMGVSPRAWRNGEGRS
jgi:AraC-like DNA-binding protein